MGIEFLDVVWSPVISFAREGSFLTIKLVVRCCDMEFIRHSAFKGEKDMLGAEKNLENVSELNLVCC